MVDPAREWTPRPSMGGPTTEGAGRRLSGSSLLGSIPTPGTRGPGSVWGWDGSSHASSGGGPSRWTSTADTLRVRAACSNSCHWGSRANCSPYSSSGLAKRTCSALHFQRRALTATQTVPPSLKTTTPGPVHPSLRRPKASDLDDIREK
eukprot:6645430-Pyramimonas_sp.AAC.1